MNAVQIVIPCLIAVLLLYALLKKVNIYKAFAQGAADALPQLINVLPYLAAMLTALDIIRGSGALGAFVRLLAPIGKACGINEELIPLIVLRPFSGSASLALLKDTLATHGADSYIGRAASVLVGSTETVFYTAAVYFGAVGVTKTRQAIPAALISGAVGVAVGLLLIK